MGRLRGSSIGNKISVIKFLKGYYELLAKDSFHWSSNVWSCLQALVTSTVFVLANAKSEMQQSTIYLIFDWNQFVSFEPKQFLETRRKLAKTKKKLEEFKRVQFFFEAATEVGNFCQKNGAFMIFRD